SKRQHRRCIRPIRRHRSSYRTAAQHIRSHIRAERRSTGRAPRMRPKRQPTSRRRQGPKHPAPPPTTIFSAAAPERSDKTRIMETIYKYRFGRRTLYWTAIYFVFFALLGGLLYHLYEGGYLSAWFTSFVAAVVALMSLSIPRKIVVTDDRIEVRCLLDITELRLSEIASVRRVPPREMKWMLP